MKRLLADTATGNLPIVSSGGSGNMGCSDIYSHGNTLAIGVSSAATYSFTSGGAGTLYGGGGTQGPILLPNTTYKLYVAGYTGATGYIAISDQRLKKNIKKIENPLTKISKISGYTYDWNHEVKSDRKLDSLRQSGFLAQEILKVLPEAVVQCSDGLYGINYNGILPLLTEGIKAQQSKSIYRSLKLRI